MLLAEFVEGLKCGKLKIGVRVFGEHALLQVGQICHASLQLVDQVFGQVFSLGYSRS